MANTGNTQQQIDYGAAANDGQGDPLRTAFIKTDDNFDNIWLAGPVGSNITIVNNTLQSNNTNGNIVLRPNGVGVVQANAAIVPNATNLRDLGTADLRFRAAYVGTGGLSVDGNIAADYVVVNTDLTVNGNLIVEGDVIQIGNIVTDSLTIQLANTATTDAQANGSGITVGANDDVATLLYNSTDNEWRTNIGANIAGNVGANYFIGNGSLLTGIASTYGNANVADFLADFGSNNISTSGNISAPGGVGGNGQVVYNYAGVLTVAPSNFNFDQDTQTLFLTSLSVAGNSNTGRDAVYIGVPGVTSLGPDTLLQATANFDSYAQINMQNLSAAAEASGDFIITADNGTDDTHYINLGMAGSGWNGDQPNSLGDNVNANDGFLYVQDGDLVIGVKSGVSDAYVWRFSDQGITGTGNIIPSANAVYSLGNATNYWSNLWVANNTIYIGGVPLGITAGNVLTVAGNAVLTNGSNTTISTTGNITADYFFGNGSQLTGLSTGSISNGTSNVEIATANGNVTINTNGTYAWSFDDTGNMTFPSNGQIVMDGGDGTIGNQSDDFVISWDNEEIRVVSVGGSIEMQADAAFRVQTNYDGANVLYASRWEFSNNELVNISGNFGIVSEAGNLTLSGGRDGVNSGNTIISAVDLGSAVFNWTFANNGDLNLPSEGNIVGVTPNNAGRMQWVGNSSGDGNGYTTIQLVPDETVFGNDQYLIIDPTGGSPGHIHIRAGGTQDNSSADLFLGGENSYVKLPAGPDPNVQIAANTLVWTFGSAGAYGELTLPAGEGAIRTIDDTLALVSLNTTTGNANSVYLGSSGGLGFYDQEIGGNWLEIFRSGSEPEIRVPVGGGNLNIQTAEGANVYNWTFDNTGNLTAPGNISTTGNITANSFIGNISVTGNVTGTTANVTLIAGSYSWTFDNTGNIQGNLSFTGSDIVINNAPGGAEGAEVKWALPAPANTTLNGQVIQDVYQNGMRFFESGGTSRGLYMDMANAPAGAGTAVGYRDIPQVAFTGDATLAATDAGKHYYSTLNTGNTLTIANNTSVSWSVGTAITVVNRGTGNITVAQGTGVSLYLAGNSSAGNRTVSTYGMATLLNVAANVWMINGTGVS